MARSSVQPITPGTASDVSALLKAWGCGDLAARDQLMLVVYDELRRRARAYMRRERIGHTLQPTALVHEAYLRAPGKFSSGIRRVRPAFNPHRAGKVDITRSYTTGVAR